MKDWFDSLEARERLFVSGGAIVVALAVLYGLIWLPLANSHQQAQENVRSWETAVAELRPLAALQKNGGSSNTQRPNTSQTPVIIVDQTLRARGLDGAMKRSQPTTSNGIRVEFENVAFDDLVLWLGDLSGQYALQVSSGSLSDGAQTGPGRINATLTLERSL